MAVLMVGEAEKQQIKNLIAFAALHPYSTEQLKKIIAGELKAPGDSALNNISLPVGFNVTYTVEEQPFGKARHISVSVDRPGKLPAPEAVDMILEEFGFRGRLMDKTPGVHFWVEAEKAINVVEALC